MNWPHLAPVSYTHLADAVTDQDLDGDLRIILFLIRKVDKSTGNAVGHLVGMRRVYFFKHISFLSERDVYKRQGLSFLYGIVDRSIRRFSP